MISISIPHFTTEQKISRRRSPDIKAERISSTLASSLTYPATCTPFIERNPVWISGTAISWCRDSVDTIFSILAQRGQIMAPPKKGGFLGPLPRHKGLSGAYRPVQSVPSLSPAGRQRQKHADCGHRDFRIEQWDSVVRPLPFSAETGRRARAPLRRLHGRGVAPS